MWRLRTAVLAALLGHFQFGIALSIINTMLNPLSESVGMEENIGGAVATGALYVGACIGSLFAGPFEKSSRKYAQVWIGFLYATGSLLCGFTNEHKVCWGGPFDGCIPDMILIGRLATGLAGGFSGVVSPKYLAEISPPQIRGALGASTQLLVALGAFMGLLIGLPMEFDVDIGYSWWRMMFLASSIPGIVQALLAFLTFPLFKQTNTELRKTLKASSNLVRVLSSVRSQEITTANERQDVEAVQEKEMPTDHPSNTKPSEEMPLSEWEQWKTNISLFVGRRYRRCVILGATVPSICVLSGVNIVASYSTTIFEDTGLEQAIVGSILFGIGNIVGSFITVILFDRLGRTTMASISFGGMAISHVAMALVSLMSDEASGPLSVLCMFLFIVSFGAGCGALLLAYGPEVVPPELKGMVLGSGLSLSLIVALIQVLTFPSILDAIGVLSSFLILGGITMGCLIFLKVFMIETKGKELEDIISELTEGKGRGSK